MGFIDARAADPIGLTEIATAAQLSPRALQATFRRHLGTTPLGHLRSVRLARVHADPPPGAATAGQSRRSPAGGASASSAGSLRLQEAVRPVAAGDPQPGSAVTEVRRTIRTSALPVIASSTADPVHAHDYICDAYANTTMRLIGDQTSLRMRDEQHDLGWLTMSDFSHTAGLEQSNRSTGSWSPASSPDAGGATPSGRRSRPSRETCASWRNPTGPA